MPDESPAELRQRAATARRLAGDLSARDAGRLIEIAHELESRADALDAAQQDDGAGAASGLDCHRG